MRDKELRGVEPQRRFQCCALSYWLQLSSVRTFCRRAAPDAPECIYRRRRCTGRHRRTCCGGSRGGASLPPTRAHTPPPPPPPPPPDTPPRRHVSSLTPARARLLTHFQRECKHQNMDLASPS